jgi:hypothetical protein
VAVPTEAQKADIFYFCGWPQRFIPTDAFPLEQGIAAISQIAAQWAIITNPIDGSPSGLLAQLRKLHDVTIPAAYERLQVIKVGPIELDGQRELRELRNQGRRLVSALCGTLGVIRANDVFAPGVGSYASARLGESGSGSGSSNWVGKC